MRDLDTIRARAIEWHIRLRDGDGDDWNAFSEWLGEDPRHAEIYDVIEDADRAIGPMLGRIDFREAANDADDDVGAVDGAARSHKWRWLTGGLVAAASLAVVMLSLPSSRSDPYSIRTAAGERRVVMLDSQTRVVMNGNTTMQFDRNNPRFASLVTGEALFDVRHDEAKPFTLHVGENRLRDAGTMFDVVNTDAGLRVAVSEGQVIYNPDAERVALNPGQQLVAPAGATSIRVENVARDAVGAWEHGRFVYDGAPLSQVTADLERALGITIKVDATIAERPVSGSIVLDGKGTGQIERLNHALDVSIVPGPDGWTMKPAAGALR